MFFRAKIKTNHASFSLNNHECSRPISRLSVLRRASGVETQPPLRASSISVDAFKIVGSPRTFHVEPTRWPNRKKKKKIGCQRSLWVHLHRNCKRRLIGSMAQGKDLCIHISTEQENVRYQQPAESAHYPKSWYYCQRSFGCVVCPGQERLQMQPMNNKIWCIKFGANNGASGLSVFFFEREREVGRHSTGVLCHVLHLPTGSAADSEYHYWWLKASSLLALATPDRTHFQPHICRKCGMDGRRSVIKCY